MSGEGRDEPFAGYENYRNLFLLEHLKKLSDPLRKRAATGITWLGRRLDSRVLSKYGPRMSVLFEDYYLSRTSSPFEFFPGRTFELVLDYNARSD